MKRNLVIAAMAAASANAIFFFQDMKPQSYKDNDILDLHVGELWSKKSSITYDYYDLPWCNKNEGPNF